MAIFDFLTDLRQSFRTKRKRKKRNHHRHPSFSRVHSNKDHGPQPQAVSSTGQAKTHFEEESGRKQNEVGQPVDYAVAHQDATLIITYQDEDGQALRPPQIISGGIGQMLHLRFDDFPEYDLVRIDGFTSIFVDQYGAIRLTYRKKDAAVLWVVVRDIDDGSALRPPVFVRGSLGEPYSLTSPTIKGYRLLQAQGPTVGTLTEKQQTVKYLYRKSKWETVTYRVFYIRALEFTQTADDPDGKPLSLTLAKGSVWQTFSSIKVANGTWWHCLGGDVWVKESPAIQRMTSRPSQPLSTVDNPDALPPVIQLHHKAKIDYVPGHELILYDRPFGHQVTTIKDGKEVTLTGRMRISHMMWFCVDDLGWTIRQYLDLDPHPEDFLAQVKNKQKQPEQAEKNA